MYQWGRKDPMPPLVYRDGTFYDVIGEVGTVRSKDADYKNDVTSPAGLRIFQMETSVGGNNGYYQPTVADDVKTNIENSIKYPLKPIYNTKADQTMIAATWFAGNSYDNLWSDNSQGTYDSNGDLNSHVKAYMPKSPFDPCPNKWRIPSKLSSKTAIPINFNPFGQNISTIKEGPLRNINFKPKGVSTYNGNAIYNGIKIYPHIGFDLSKIDNPNNGGTTNMGLMPGTGAYELYRKEGKFTPYFSDTHQTFLWTATMGNDNDNLNVRPGQMIFTPDPGNTAHPDSANYSAMIGSYGINFITSEANETQAMNACRCMQDPYADNETNPLTAANYDFPVDPLPITTNTPVYYSKGLSNPNSYLLVKSTSPQIVKTEISPNNFVSGIPIDKAFSVYNNYLSDHQLPVTAFGNLKVNVHWTSEPGLITNVKLNQQPASLADLDSTFINVTVGAGKSGNAVISLHDGNVNNPVLWSWHIWIANSDPTTNAITYKTESDDILENDGILQGDVINYVGFTNSGSQSKTNVFMDRNLGALEALPSISTASSTDTIVQNSGGLQYQWGRKDPIPTFISPGFNSASVGSVVGASQPVYRSPLGPDSNGNLSASSFTEIVTGTSYRTPSQTAYAKLYDAFIKGDDESTDDKQTKIRKHLKKSIQYPFSFIHQNIKTGMFEDWLLDEPNAMPERWGHAAEKSSFDPCPSGWRVPDSDVPNTTTILDDLGNPKSVTTKGASPWYYGNYNPGSSASIYHYYNYGIFERKFSGTNENFRTSDYGGVYPGNVIKNSNISTNIRYGTVFGNSSNDFKIGNFPYTGIRGLYDVPGTDFLGNFALAPGYIGVWTSSLNENYLGGANSLQINRQLEVQTKLASDPYLAMNVRCVKVNPMINSVLAKKPDEEQKNQIANQPDEKLFPIPFKEELHINSKEEFSYLLYDMAGSLVGSGKFINQKVNFSNIINGVYIIKLIDYSNNRTLTKKIIKK